MVSARAMSRRVRTRGANMRMINRNELAQRKGITYSPRHLTRMIAAGAFPQPVKLNPAGNGRVAFVEDEIDRWLKERVEARDRG